MLGHSVPFDYLLTLAELALALTGVSGIIMVLLADKPNIKAYQLELGTVTIPSSSFFVALFALLPIGFQSIGWDDALMWKLVGALLASLFLFIYWPLMYRFQRREAMNKIPKQVLVVGIPVQIFIVMTQAVNIFEVFGQSSSGLYLVALIAFFLLYFYTFTLLLQYVAVELLSSKADEES